uniref:Uncharacterized protein n=1 Tax=viral metagenome TaxID=1070528 RepID=A0A6C0L7S4_9ZZZZ
MSSSRKSHSSSRTRHWIIPESSDVDTFLKEKYDKIKVGDKITNAAEQQKDLVEYRVIMGENERKTVEETYSYGGKRKSKKSKTRKNRKTRRK